MTTYAQIDDDGICVAVSELLGEPQGANLIAIPALDRSYLGRQWTGKKWKDAAPAQAQADPAEWLIDVGPFFDRFGAAKLAVLADTDATVRALVVDLQVRKWIDLRRPDIAQGIDLLIAKGVPGVDAALKAAILDTPVAYEENLALRKTYFA